MIKIESVHIEEVRGIRRLDLDLGKQKFAISGPNGSGKSGIIDAIEFGLTGQMGRLTGRGTKGISLGQHGPHVDKVRNPDDAFVKVKVFLMNLNKSATITRYISEPKKPEIDPDTAETRAAFAEIAEHPEITLSRREILRFILVEPTKRSEEIQALLRLGEIGEARSVLLTAQNKLSSASAMAENAVTSSVNALKLHLQIPATSYEAILEAANKKRSLLGLNLVLKLDKDTDLAEGLAAGAAAKEFNKESALRSIEALSREDETSAELGKTEADAIVADLSKLESDPSLLAALQQRDFVEKGLSLVANQVCPLCDTEWPDIEHLKAHLQAKLDKSKEAKNLQDSVLRNNGVLSGKILQFAALISPVTKLAQAVGDKEFQQILIGWKSDLDEFRGNLNTVDNAMRVKSRLEASFLRKPENFSSALAALKEVITAVPDQSATIDAQTFLTTAQERLKDVRRARSAKEGAVTAETCAKIAYETFCTVMEQELNALYEQVEGDFSTFYRALNGPDEATFKAQFKPTAGSLAFDVDFYGRGLVPPAAYHSEGHQDGMGVCLYLALMKRLFGKQFTLSLLDDVVMSVDSAHRHEFCKLLIKEFPDTQFIITTHDRLWAEQMKAAKLVEPKTSILFHGWSLETGPVVQSDGSVWEEISTSLQEDRVDLASAALRRHLEYSAGVLADQLGARPQYRMDGTYEMDEMLTSVLARGKDLWKKAAYAADTWKDEEHKLQALEKIKFLKECDGAARMEQWAVNRAVHYNSWANFTKNDFEPVVEAFKNLLESFRCERCGVWIYVLPKVSPKALRCDCSKIDFNMIPKPKLTSDTES